MGNYKNIIMYPPANLSKIKRYKIFVAVQSSFETTQKNSTLILSKLLHIHNRGKMKFYLYSILTILLYLSSRYLSVKIKPELQKNILQFGYGINYKYEGTLAHSFDRIYVILNLFYHPWMI